MSMSAFQKVTLVSCLFLCVSLLLPKLLLSRGRQDIRQREGGPGRFPPVTPEFGAASGPEHRVSRQQQPSGEDAGRKGKASQLSQILPIYGFGIFLYIVYTLMRMTSKGKSGRMESRLRALASVNLKRNITDYQLAQMEEKLRETEEMMDPIVTKLGSRPKRAKSVTQDQEEKVRRRRLREISRIIKDGRLTDSISPEVEAEESSYVEDWEGYDEETFPQYEEPCKKRSNRRRHSEEPGSVQPTPEQLAERMEEDGSAAEEEGEPLKGDEEEQEGKESTEEEEEADGEKQQSEDELEPTEKGEELVEEMETFVDEGESAGQEESLTSYGEQMNDEEVEAEPLDAPTSSAGAKEVITQNQEQKPKKMKKISFSQHREVFCYSNEGSNENCKCFHEEAELEEEEEDEEEDVGEGDVEEKLEEEDDNPVLVAESLGLNLETFSDPEEQQPKEEEEEEEEDEENDMTETEEERPDDSEDTTDVEFGVLRKRIRRLQM